MNDFDLLVAIGGADDTLKQEVIDHMKNTNGKYTRRPSHARRTLRLLPAAAAIICLLAVTAYAAVSFFGLREFHEKYQVPTLPPEAQEIIETHDESGSGELITYQLKEVLCDSQTMKVVVEVRTAEPGKYILLPVDGGEDFGLSFIGLEGEGTIAEYAEANGLTLLYINGGLNPIGGGSFNGASLWNECLSPELQELIISADRANVAPGTKASVYVSASGKDVETQRGELPFQFEDMSTNEEQIYQPTSQPEMDEVYLKDVTVTKTELGTYLVFTAMTRSGVLEGKSLSFRIWDGEEFYASVPILKEGDNHTYRIEAGQLELGDSFTLELWDCFNKTTYEGIEYTKAP